MLLVKKAIKDHDFIPSNSILSNALSWGVKLLHIDDIRYYIKQKRKELYLLKESSTSVRDVHLLRDTETSHRVITIKLLIIPCLS